MSNLIGLGSDLLRIDRIARFGAARGRLLLDRILAPAERASMAGLGERAEDWPACASRIATLMAAKEAFFKALGTGLVRPLRWADVAVRSDGPALALSGASAAAFNAAGGSECRLSLAGDRHFVLAIVALLGGQARPEDRIFMTIGNQR